MPKDNEPIAVTPELSLPQTESQRFTAEEMVRCEECLRANPPTRVECLYCAAALPISTSGSAQARPSLRPLEKWEQGQNCILINAAAAIVDESVAEAASLLRLGAIDLSRIIETRRPLPLARVATAAEAAIIQEHLRRFGLESVVVSDEALGLETRPIRRLRTIELLDRGLVVFPSSGEAQRIDWSELRMVISGRLHATQIETRERTGRGAEKQILDARETANDEAVLDLYTQAPDGGWRILANNFDFSCLAERKAWLARNNFSTLRALIQERTPHAIHDDAYHSLRRCLELVWPSDQQTSSLGWHRDRVGKYSTGEVTSTTNESQFTRYSRLCQYLQSQI